MLKKNFDEQLVAGCDEAGRGALAGDVFAATVILPQDYYNHKIQDSKTLSPRLREELREEIENHAISYAVSQISVEEIDSTNILKSTMRAMHLALQQLNPQPKLILIDGNYFRPNYCNVPHQCIVKGDNKYMEIAAASILAKTYRDNYMRKIHKQCIYYSWQSNKGYSSKQHRTAIEIYGKSIYHRKSFG